MRAISLWQPWASLWASGRKVHETRHWPTAYRGPLAIHASWRFVPPFRELENILLDEFGLSWGDLATGAIVGTCRLVACHQITDADRPRRQYAHGDDCTAGNWAPGRFAWEGAEFRLFKQPIPWKGQQGFFSVPDNVIEEAA